jgi:hypothetical protein
MPDQARPRRGNKEQKEPTSSKPHIEPNSSIFTFQVLREKKKPEKKRKEKKSLRHLGGGLQQK